MYKGSIVVKPLEDGIFWELLEEFSFKTKDTPEFICVPKGFLTDFASIPRVFWTFVGSPASGKARRAAVCHDYLYKFGKHLGIKRKKADEIFLELMKEDGVGYIKRYSMFWAVRAAGSSSYEG